MTEPITNRLTRLGIGPQDRAAMVIDIGAVVANWCELRSRSAPATCAAVVKADAYGLGADRVVPALSRAGCNTFFVATRDEGVAVSRLVPDAIVYVLDGFWGDSVAPFSERLRPLLSSLAQIDGWRRAAATSGQRLPAALHVDTGMSRLGLEPERVVELVSDRSRMADLDLALVMTHPACADDPGDAMTVSQMLVFDEAASLIDTPRSFANSAAALTDAAARGDLVRPGISLYGGQALGDGAPTRAAVTLCARVLQVRAVPEGTPVGYGATFVTTRPSRLATLAVGYADGYQRRINADPARAPHVVFGEHAAPLAGRISMDTIVADVTDIAGHTGGAVSDGDFAEIIGPNVPIQLLAELAGTIDYEILTGLRQARAKRVWVEDNG